jgi:uncharacterized membrane-anchored protein
MTGKRLIVAAVVLAVAQIGFLAWVIAGRAAILQNGTEVLLKVEPIDPRDLLRGDYVRLGYEINAVPLTAVVNRPAGTMLTEAVDIYVRVRKDTDGYWRVASASLNEPLAAAPGADEADIRGTVAPGWTLNEGDSLRADYGIDRFYLPEGEGLQIQADMRVRPFGILAAIAKDGTAQIKALMDGKTKLFEEPLY